MNEVQDFSMPNKNKQVSSNKGKLDSMLDKLMKRKSCVSTFFKNTTKFAILHPVKTIKYLIYFLTVDRGTSGREGKKTQEVG